VSRRKPLATFRLYPERRGGLFVRVNVWRTRAELLERERWIDGKPLTRLRRRHGRSEAHGLCSSLTVQKYTGTRWRTLPIFAEVNLYRERLGMEVVTHELFHATAAWGRRVRFDFARLDADDSVNAAEERMAYVHGALCRQFVCRAERARLYEADRWQHASEERQRGPAARSRRRARGK
jgi:hypothetical protein